MKNKKISWKNLPKRSPFLATIVYGMALDRWNAPEWLYGFIGAILIGSWVVFIRSRAQDEVVDIFECDCEKECEEVDLSQAGTPETVDDAIKRLNSKILDLPSDVVEKISDGYHTFEELYEFRKMYNAALFNEWASNMAANPRWAKEDSQPVYLPKYDVHKSWRHNDGELCFGGGWFIVVAKLPTGLISNHYKAEDWDLFRIPEAEKARYEFDGHTSKDVLDRLKAL